MGIAIADCIQTWWWYPDLAGDRVTQHPHASKAMLTAIAGDEHPSPSPRGVLSTRTAKRLNRVVHYARPHGLGGDTIDSRRCHDSQNQRTAGM